MREQRTFSTEAVILKQSDLGEADRVVTLFTPYKGKLHAIAKGSRRPGSKKAGHLELLCHSQVQLAQGRNFTIVTQAETIENFTHLRNEQRAMTCGFYLAEVFHRFIADDIQDKDVYELLLLALRELDADYGYDRTQMLLRYVEIHLLAYVGYEPVLQICAHCHVKLLPQENGFNASLGVALCPNCSHLWNQSLSTNALKVLRILQRSTWSQVASLHLEVRLSIEVELVMRGLLRFHLERDLKSWAFLAMVHKQHD